MIGQNWRFGEGSVGTDSLTYVAAPLESNFDASLKQRFYKLCHASEHFQSDRLKRHTIMADYYTYIGEVYIPSSGGWIRASVQAPDTVTATQMLASMNGGPGNVAAVWRED